jgi:enoyl-CoA hydratase/carnithine racemase
MDTGTERLIASVEDGVGWIVFNNTDKHNAMTAAMLAALAGVCEQFADDPAVRTVVLRGAGERAFISGADIGQLDTGELGGATAPPDDDADSRVTAGLAAIEKPVLAMIHGYCLGGGVAMALAADIRICADDAQFGIPAARLGVGYPYEATARLVALVGPGHAAEILFGGARIDAAEATRIGLVNRCLPKPQLEGSVRSLALTIAGNAPLSHVAHKRAIRAAAIGGLPADRAAITAAIAAAWGSDDFSEGRRAFLNRRPARFTGH